MKDTTNHTCFPNIDPSAFENCFCNVGSVGIPMQFYVREAPGFSRIRHFWKKIMDNKKKNSEDLIAV
jgi:hypothetical protein